MSGKHRWFSTDGHEIPTWVWCETVGYPHADEHGRTQYGNTHFDTEAEAWEAGQASVDAIVSMAVREVKAIRERLAAAEAELVEATIKRADFNDARMAAEVGE